MIQLGSVVGVTDKTCVVLAQCIKVVGSLKKRIAFWGEIVIVTVKWINVRKLRILKVRAQLRFLTGTIHRGVLIRAKVFFVRSASIRVRFDQNIVVLITRQVVPVSNRVYGPVLREMCMKWPSLGCVSQLVV